MKSASSLPTAVKDLLKQNFICQQINSASSRHTAVKDMLKQSYITQQSAICIFSPIISFHGSYRPAETKLYKLADKSASSLPSSLSMAVTTSRSKTSQLAEVFTSCSSYRPEETILLLIESVFPHHHVYQCLIGKSRLYYRVFSTLLIRI